MTVGWCRPPGPGGHPEGIPSLYVDAVLRATGPRCQCVRTLEPILRDARFPENLRRIRGDTYLLVRMTNGGSISARDRDNLIAHVGWIRDLARRIAADRDRADDLAQETCIVALGRRPRNAPSIKGWLRTIMQNLARRQGANENSRREREASAARTEHPRRPMPWSSAPACSARSPTKYSPSTNPTVQRSCCASSRICRRAPSRRGSTSR